MQTDDEEREDNSDNEDDEDDERDEGDEGYPDRTLRFEKPAQFTLRSLLMLAVVWAVVLAITMQSGVHGATAMAGATGLLGLFMIAAGAATFRGLWLAFGLGLMWLALLIGVIGYELGY